MTHELAKVKRKIKTLTKQKGKENKCLYLWIRLLIRKAALLYVIQPIEEDTSG